jgi:hypothetical protein
LAFDELRKRKEPVRRGRDIHLIVQRARIVLYAHAGRGTEEIGRTAPFRGSLDELVTLVADTFPQDSPRRSRFLGMDFDRKH